MDDGYSSLSRRERQHAETVDELRQHATALLDEGGAGAVTLSAIARNMGMSAPALYRYVDSLDALLTDLVVNGYEDLAAALRGTLEATPPSQRLREVAREYRAWAIARPNRYRLMFASPLGAGTVAPHHTVGPAHASMLALLDAATAATSAAGHGDAPSPLSTQLRAWAQQRTGDEETPTALLQLGVVAWTRLHGIISLEIEGVFAAMGINAGLMYDVEVDHIQAQLRTPNWARDPVA